MPKNAVLDKGSCWEGVNRSSGFFNFFNLFFNGKTTVFDGGNGKKAMPVSFAHEFKN